MTSLREILASWKQDPLLKRVVRNSSYLFSSNVALSILGLVQGVIAIRLIGFANWGLVATIQTFASNINRFLSFRMSEVVVKHLAPSITEGNKKEAAAIVKAAGITEAVTSIVAFLALLLLAPWAATNFAKDPSTSPLYIFYGLILLSNLVYETSTGVLQATHHFNHLARANLIQSIITFSFISITYVLYRWGGVIPMDQLVAYILLAYILGKTYVGIALVFHAIVELNRLLGKGWWRTSLRLLPNKRALASFMLNTNLNGTVNLFFRDNIQLYLSWLVSTTATGYFKLAMTLILPITFILDPLIAPTYSEISQTIARFQWDITRRLLRRITIIGAGVVSAIWLGWALTGWWIIPTLYKPQAMPVYPLLLILTLGYGFASIFQWNRSLFLSLGKPGYPLLISILMGVIELALVFTLVPRYGYLMMGIILSGYFIISIGFISLRGLLEIRSRMKAAGTA